MRIPGLILAVAGAIVALWCVGVFAVIGRGTPFPFDPPRRLVVRGPYRFVRNPMALGVGSVLAGGALYYESWPLAVVTGTFFLIIHLFVVLYEEPTLIRMFGDEYAAYRADIHRWLPTLRPYRPSRTD